MGKRHISSDVMWEGTPVTWCRGFSAQDTISYRGHHLSYRFIGFSFYYSNSVIISTIIYYNYSLYTKQNAYQVCINDLLRLLHILVIITFFALAINLILLLDAYQYNKCLWFSWWKVRVSLRSRRHSLPLPSRFSSPLPTNDKVLQ